MSHDDRKRVWVHEFQTRLTLRIAGYLVLFLGVLVNFLFAWQLFTGGLENPGTRFVEMLRTYLPVLLCLIVLVPVMAWDAMRFTHRLVGPLVRLRRAMQEVAGGTAVPPVRFRQGDYLDEVRDDFNGMLESLQRRGLPVLKPAIPVEKEPAPPRPA